MIIPGAVFFTFVPKHYALELVGKIYTRFRRLRFRKILNCLETNQTVW